MPRATIWIRNDDMPKWEAIENRPEWLHEHLNGGNLTLDAMRVITDGMVGDETPQRFYMPASLANQPEVKEELKRMGMDLLDDPTYTDAEDTA